jgi:recombination protein RecT
MSQTLRNIQSARQGNPTNVVSFPAMLEQLKGEIARALPKHLSAERMARIALTAFRMKIRSCPKWSHAVSSRRSSSLASSVCKSA